MLLLYLIHYLYARVGASDPESRAYVCRLEDNPPTCDSLKHSLVQQLVGSVRAVGHDVVSAGMGSGLGIETVGDGS
jgi:hypothetical protein